MERWIGLVVLSAAALAAACAPIQKRTQAAAPAPAPRAVLSPDRAEAQRKAYEQGLGFYGEERYAEARKAWTESARLGPGTPVGKKAQANLLKVEGILKRLQEIEKQ